MDDIQKKALGERIKERRLTLGLSQGELAKSVNKSSPAYIAFIESGERNISTMDLMLLAKQLGTTVSELIGENKNNKKPEFLDALRSSTGVDADDRKKIEEFYQYLKSRKKNDRSK